MARIEEDDEQPRLRIIVFLSTGPSLMIPCDHFEEQEGYLVFLDSEKVIIGKFVLPAVIGWYKAVIPERQSQQHVQ